jgi:hypothetical protein
MITKSEFAAANEALLAEERGRLGPPAAGEVLAFTRGELSPDAEAIMRDRLIAYPDLLRTLTAPFPEPAQPGDPDYLSDHELGRHWAALQKRRGRPEGGNLLPFWRAFGAIAAMLAVVFGVLLWRARTELTTPRLLSNELLLPDARRGGGDASTELRPAGDFYLLVPFVGEGPAEWYRAEIVDVSTPPRTLWSSGEVARRPDGSVLVLVPRGFLPPGRYRLLLYARGEGRDEPPGSYTLRVPNR